MAEGGEANTSLQEMVSDPSLEDAEGEGPLIFDTCKKRLTLLELVPFEPRSTCDCTISTFQKQIAKVPFYLANEPTLYGLREISSLASWTVSTHKPHCGAPALLQPTPSTFWQSDGPQPHHLTVHFPRTVTILKIRIYLDFSLDESYTPTRMEFYGGLHGENYGLVQFAEWKAEEPRGWQDISVEGCGPGGSDGIRARVLEIRVIENHQNGKDTHVRGVQIFARDERVRMTATGTPFDMQGMEEDIADMEDAGHDQATGRKKRRPEREFVGEEPIWMAEPELR